MIHLVYPHGPGIKAPWTIGRHVSRILREHGYVVRNYDWDAGPTPIPLGPDDVLLGHPHPEGRTFISAMGVRGWRKKVALFPVVTDGRCDWALPVLAKCDASIAISGRYWWQAGRGEAWRGVASSGEAQSRQAWSKVPGLRRVDMAIEASEFPTLERTWNPPDKRRIAYIGCALREKGFPYLMELDAELRRTEGNGGRIHWFFGVDFSTEAGRRDLATCDFVIAPGTSDANPTTIVEAMAWGLIPVATERSGYGYDSSGITHLPNDDVAGAALVLRGLSRMPEEQLEAIRRQNFEIVRETYTWDRFCAPILEAIGY